MYCEWCGYDFYEVSEFFEGYSIFKSDGSLCIGKYCSINCCVAKIEEAGIEVAERKQRLYDFYKLHIDVSPATSPSNLIKKGGKLNYYEYRYNFVCPGFEPRVNRENEGYGESEDFFLSEEDADGYDSY